MITKNTRYATILGLVVIAALLAMPVTLNQSEAQSSPVYDPEMVQYIRTIIGQTGTTTFTEADDMRNVTTTNTVVQGGSTYAVHTVTTADGTTINDETVAITQNNDGTYRLVNVARSIDVVFTDNEDDYLQGRATQSQTQATITLHDREHADEGELITLTDNYQGCSGNYATFTAAVDTTDDTYMTWKAQPQFFSYCLLYHGFDEVKITHEGHVVYSSSRQSSIDMWNANGEGWYTATVKVYYD